MLEVPLPVEASLLAAYQCWGDFLVADDVEALSEAVRISAGFHPKYHFLESGLHTELAALYLGQGQWQAADTHFTRAVFLHHDNATALAGQAAARAQARACLPEYAFEMADFLSCSQGSEAEHSIFALRTQAREARTPEAYLAAIELCEQTHLHYHRLAARPWWLRAQYFAREGEALLAANDLRRGRDLDKHLPDVEV